MAKYRKLDGLEKICGCKRQNWSECRHAWHFAFMWQGKKYRFSLDKHLGRRIDSKTKADAEAENLRNKIRKGEFGQPAPNAEMTVRQLADVYLERYVANKYKRKDGKKTVREQAFESALRVICETPVALPTGGTLPFGRWRVVDVVPDSVERFREARYRAGTGPTGTNRYLGQIRATWAWGIRSGYAMTTPFKINGEVAVKLEKERKRTRRLLDGEEDRLLSICGPHLRAVVEAALATGMRRGEILNLQWRDIHGMRIDGEEIEWLPKAEILLPADKTKTKQDRRIPISARLKAVLEMRRFDPNGDPHEADSYVFGTEVGTRIRDVGRAWETAVLKAHGHTPKFSGTSNLGPESRASLDKIDLHFHDLRREAGSRWLEGGVPLHTVRDWLGHTSIAQTSTYLAGTMQTQHDAMARFDAISENLGNRSGKRGSGRPRTAGSVRRKPRKTVVGGEATIN